MADSSNTRSRVWSSSKPSSEVATIRSLNEPSENAEDWLSASATAERLGVSQRTIRRAIARGDLSASKRSGVFQIAPSDLAEYRTRHDLSPLEPMPGTANLPRLSPLPPRAIELSGSLPTPLTPLIGRERESKALVDLLLRDGVRLLI